MKRFEAYLDEKKMPLLGPQYDAFTDGLFRDGADSVHRAAQIEVIARVYIRLGWEKDLKNWAWDPNWFKTLIKELMEEDGRIRRHWDSSFWPGLVDPASGKYEYGSRDMLNHILSACALGDHKEISRKICKELSTRFYLRDYHFRSNAEYPPGHPRAEYDPTGSATYERKYGALLGPDFQGILTRATGYSGRFARTLGDMHLCADSIIWNFRKSTDMNSHFCQTVTSYFVDPTHFSKINAKYLFNWHAFSAKMESYHTFGGISIEDFVEPLKRISNHFIAEI